MHIVHAAWYGPMNAQNKKRQKIEVKSVFESREQKEKAGQFASGDALAGKLSGLRLHREVDLREQEAA